MEFRLGNVVTLKSSKLHKMTVNDVEANTGKVECVWFEGKELKREWFNPEALEHYVEPELSQQTNNRRPKR